MAISNPVAPPPPPPAVIVAPVPAIKQARSPSHVKAETTRAIDAAEKQESAVKARGGKHRFGASEHGYDGDEGSGPGSRIDVTV